MKAAVPDAADDGIHPFTFVGDEPAPPAPADARLDAGLPPKRNGRWTLQGVALALLSLAIWAGCLWGYSLYNDFPGAYHPDELSKVEQLLSDRRNFNHPQLMLEAARFVTSVPPPTDEDALLRQSRRASAAFGAGAAVLMAWAGWAAAGWAGFLYVGLAVALCPALLSHAHFFKEDAALVFGVAAVLCAGAWVIRLRGPGPQLWAVLATGAAAGLAASGKYCGAVMLLPAVVAAVLAPLCRRNWGLALAAPLLVVVFAVAAWTVVDWRVAMNFDTFVDGVTRETEHSQDGHHGLTMDRPTQYFNNLVWTEAMPHVKWLVAIGAVAGVGVMAVRRDFAGPAFGVWLATTGAAYAVMLSYSTIPFYRYALPVTVMAYALGGLGAAFVCVLLPGGVWRGLGIAAGVGVIGALQGLRCADYTNQFADDSRDALREWAWTQAPAGASVAVDYYAMPYYAEPGGYGPIVQRLRVARVFGSMPPFTGVVNDLRRSGVRYVITCGTSNERFLSPYVKPDEGNTYLTRTTAFYRELRQYPVAWSRVAKHPMWTFANPDIVVYDISSPPSTAPSTRSAIP